MPLFEVAEGSLVRFQRLVGGTDLYEKEIEQLLWANPEELTGEPLFRVARQRSLPKGGRPDVIALDKTGRVVVIEVKRNYDRNHLAQTLEYAGWALATNLDELSGLYHGGQESFFADWQSFTDTDQPTIVTSPPRLMLVARDLDDRTEEALTFLLVSGVAAAVVTVTVYEDETGRRFLDAQGEHELEAAGSTAGDRIDRIDFTRVGGRKVELADLLEYGLLQVDDQLEWRRPKVGEEHRATLLANSSIRLSDGRTFSSPSAAAATAANGSFDGWTAWRVPRLNNRPTLSEVRRRYVELRRAGGAVPPTASTVE